MLKNYSKPQNEKRILRGLTSSQCLLIRIVAIWFSLLLVAPQSGWAAGTPAGAVISSSATGSYTLGGAAQTPVTSAPASFKVDEVIQPTLTWQDGGPVSVNAPGANDALTFLLTNSGNGQEAFSLTRTNGPAPLPSGNYTPADGSIGSIYLENGLQAGFQPSGPNADTAYAPGVNDPNLAPNAGQIIYVISNTPNAAANARGDVLLTAASRTAGAAGAAPGTSFAGLGQGGSFAVVGGGRGQAGATGSYVVSGLALVVNKAIASTLDPSGGATLAPGSVITYQIAVTLSGTGTATNVVITDPLPANTSYVPNSITVDGAAQTDAADSDKAQFINATQTVSVSLGNVAAPANIVITFRATIN